MIGAGGKPLLEWLTAYTFPAEEGYRDLDYAREVARAIVAENLRHGITTAAVFGTVHPKSVDALFEAAQRHELRMIAGKVLMDRNAPASLCDDAQRGYDEGKALIERWHGRGRLAYAVTPRFAATSTPAQLEAAATLWRETPDAYLQSHVAENRAEVDWMRTLYPAHARYLDVYAHFGLLGRRAVYAHGIHLDEGEFAQLAQTRTALAHCPTSNNFLGSGLFSLQRALDARRPVACRAGDRPRRRHELLDAADDAGGERGRAALRPPAACRLRAGGWRHGAPRRRSTWTDRSDRSSRDARPTSSCSTSIRRR